MSPDPWSPYRILNHFTYDRGQFTYHPGISIFNLTPEDIAKEDCADAWDEGRPISLSEAIAKETILRLGLVAMLYRDCEEEVFT